MANGVISGPPQVDFYSMLSGLGDTLQNNAKLRKQQQVDQARQTAFSALDPNSADFGQLATVGAVNLLKGGDLEGGTKLLTLAQAADERRQTQSNADRQFGLSQNADKRAQDAADEGKFAIREVENPDGTKSLYRVKTTGAEGAINTGATPAAGNPFAYGKQNETQSKDSGYANRMFDAERVLRDPKVIEAGKSYTQAGIEGVPLVPDAIKNWAHSPEYQLYDQAQRNMINAILRRESGAAISQSEFDNAYKQYIPRPGDSPEKIAEKQRNRQAAIAGIAGGGGQSYRPPYTFGPNGELVTTGNPKQGATPTKTVAAPPAAAIAALRANPSLLPQFEAKYGKGSASKSLSSAGAVSED